MGTPDSNFTGCSRLEHTPSPHAATLSAVSHAHCSVLLIKLVVPCSYER